MGFLDDIAEKIQSLLSDDESMRQIKELAAMFSGGSDSSGDSPPPFSEADGDTEHTGQNTENALDGLGINPLAIMQLMGAVSSSDKNCDLLVALRPHLGEEKQRRLDKMLKLMKLYNIFMTMRESGMLDDLDKML